MDNKRKKTMRRLLMVILIGSLISGVSLFAFSLLQQTKWPGITTIQKHLQNPLQQRQASGVTATQKHAQNPLQQKQSPAVTAIQKHAQNPPKKPVAPPTQPSFSDNFYELHTFGGFSVNTPEKALRAAQTGVRVEFQYGNPPVENGALGQMLQSLHMKVVDGFISSSMFYYECQRSRTMMPPPYALKAYCGRGVYPTFANDDAFLSAMAAHLRQAMNSRLIIGYWVLDDWAPWDEGSARQLLIKIHALIHEYTPGRAAICGFGGTLYEDATPGWSDSVAANFSPQGCDEVGLYVYSAYIPAVPNPPTSAAYDWSMSKLLPSMFRSLQQRGWNMKKEPLLGIVQAFGGPIMHTTSYQVPPTAQDIETQSRSFCEHGASALTFYGWSDSSFGPQSRTPMNSPEVEIGIKNGIAACMQYWDSQQAAVDAIRRDS
jgi:hypothetical protein